MRLGTKIALGLFLVLLGAMFLFLGMGFRWAHQDPQRFYAQIRALGIWGPVVIVLAEAFQVVFAPLPGQLLGIATGYLYGPVWGTMLSLSGLTLGSWLAMWLARKFGRPLVERLAEPRTVERLDHLAQRHGLWFFFLVFLLPILPTDVGCLVAGLTSLPIAPLVLLAIIGRFPGILVLNWVGATSRSFGAHVTVAVIVLTVLAGIIIARHHQKIQEILFAWLSRLGLE